MVSITIEIFIYMSERTDHTRRYSMSDATTDVPQPAHTNVEVATNSAMSWRFVQSGAVMVALK